MTFGQGQPPTGELYWVYAILQGGALLLLAYIICIRDPKSRKEDNEERCRRDDLFSAALVLIQDKAEVRDKDLRLAIELQTKELTKAITITADRHADGLMNQTDSINKSLERICHAKS